MATVTASRLTQLDVARRTVGIGKNELIMAELLFEQNPLFQDLKMIEANEGTKHLYGIIRGTAGAPEEGVFNQYYSEARSDQEHYEEDCKYYIKFSKIGKDVFDSSPNGSQLRNDEDKAAIEGLGQWANRTLLYGAEMVDGVKGLTPRYPTLTSASAGRFRNCWSGAGTTNLTSIWIIEHGERKTYGVYPHGTPAGISRRDLGEEPEYEPGALVSGQSGPRERRVLKVEFKLGLGLVVQDPRTTHRIANVDAVQILTTDSYATSICKLLLQAINYLPSAGTNAVIYCTRDVRTAIQISAAFKGNVFYNMTDPWGKPLMNFMGLPIKIMDQLLPNTEAQIT